MKYFVMVFLLLFGSLKAQIHENAEHIVPLSQPQLKWENGKQQVVLNSPVLAHPYNVIQAEGFFPFAQPKGFVKLQNGEQLALQFTDFGDGYYVASALLETPQQNAAFEFIFEAGAQIHEAGTLFTLDDEERQATVPAKQITRLARVRAPALIRRTEWGAGPSCASGISWQPSYTWMAFHHSATPAAVSVADAKVKVKGFQTYHQVTNGWCDIGYQFLMDGAGNFYQGRPFQNESLNLSQVPTLALGAHVGGANTANIGVSVIGCYHPPEGGACTNVMTAAAVDSLAQMYAFLSDAYGMSETNLRGHRDWGGGTSCPGDNNYGLLTTLKSKITAIKAKATPNDVEETPTDFKVASAYPNPFTQETNLRIYLPETAWISIEAYTLTGQRAAIVTQNTLSQEGWQTLNWKPEGLAAGTYPLRITIKTASGKHLERLSTITLAQ